MSGTLMVLLMTFMFLFFGYLGVPVAFSLLAGTLIGAMFTDVSQTAIIQKMFDGMDNEALLAIPFFLLVGELMSSANVVQRVANLSLSLVGHIRGGLSQVVQHGLDLGDRTLGAMPLYHTMGMHSLLAMSLVGGCFVAQPRWDLRIGRVHHRLADRGADAAALGGGEHRVGVMHGRHVEDRGGAAEQQLRARQLGARGDRGVV